MRSILIAAAAALVFASAAQAAGAPGAGRAPHCTTGVPCGNTCIAKGKTCHITPAVGPHCSANSQVCGHTCIAKGKVCHQP
jgi:hypothetical protein